MRYDVATTYDCDTKQVAAARNWVHGALTERLPSEVIEDAALIVSELVTNAIRAGCTAVRIGLALDPDCLRVGVADDAPGHPQIRDTLATDDAGRGLPIITALAEDWGIGPATQVDGKEVWAILAVS